MYSNSEPMFIVLRVLSAWIWRIDPDVRDVNQLRLVVPDLAPDLPAYELACEVARRLVKEKTLARAQNDD
jgi:hypothetical protein